MNNGAKFLIRFENSLIFVWKKYFDSAATLIGAEINKMKGVISKMFNKKIIFPAMYLLAYLFTFYIVIQYVIYKPEQAGVVSSKLKDPSFPFEVWKLFFFPHIVLGVIALLIGAYQLTKRSRRRPKLHKRLGRVYGTAILLNVLIVPYIALYATGGANSTVAFLVLDVLWFGTTALGIRAILKKDVSRHRAWMLRSYSITFVFVTFRIVLLLLQLALDASMSITFPLAVYLAIALNLIFTECYLRKGSLKTAKVLKGAI
jgi:uncharacterized membrane protein YozB (DUF420 family)